ncbi:MAG: hypothetical protein U0531_13985 [Dehalococcoidia bacterium]
MLLRALAEAAAALDRDDYREAAVRNAAFLTEVMAPDGRALRTWKDTAGPRSTAISRTTPC